MARERDRSIGGGDAPREPEERRNPLEIAVLAISALLVAGAIGVLAWQGAREERPPELAVRVDSVVSRGDAHQVHITVRNDGFATAAMAHVRARLLRDASPVAESEVVVQWVPGRSSEQATLLFEEDPRAHELDVRVVGFTEP
jgi:uncharacterized protein (TIGR02588 family)